ncbi:hypothetical protein D3C77_349590 [compost metagenome]
MSNPYEDFQLSAEEFAIVSHALKARCESAGLELKEVVEDGHKGFVLSFKCGREKREIEFWDQTELPDLLKVPFDGYVYLTGLEAISNYKDGYIEVLLRPVSSVSPSLVFTKLFGKSWQQAEDIEPIVIENAEGVSAEIGLASPVFKAINDVVSNRAITLKLKGVPARGHDATLEYLNRIASSLLFQLELITDLAVIMRRKRAPRRQVKNIQRSEPLDLRFPEREFDQAPLSLYWYARSAAGMPLLQYLAFYQVIEFYFPIYSQSEAHRKLKSILRNPVFRVERDSDISKLLTAIQVGRSGSFGDERSQLKATIEECIDESDLRQFLSADEERQEFLSVKSKLASNKLSINNQDSELKGEVARRIYELRCKIVHTKADSRDSDLELLLPFSKEADLMQFDIELAQYVARQVLISGSRPI